MLKIALPNKGRLFDDVRAVLADAGLEVRSAGERALVATLGDEFGALFVRAQDIPAFVADGAADAGITGWDCVAESGRDLEDRLDLGFGKCRVVVAARAGTELAQGGRLPAGTRVATSFPRLAERYFAKNGDRVQVVEVSGAAEVAPHLGIADVIVDLVSTGSTLKVNGLVELDTIVASSARLVSRPRASLRNEVAHELDELALALASVVRARGQRYLMANVPRAELPKVREVLPGLNGPTVVDVADEPGQTPGTSAFVAVHAVVPQSTVYRTIARLKAIGCQGILVTRIERLTP
jgi:ATP phosphoribosyltransferase